ncbi:hypothetical protein [Nocardioides sp.]|uniref:hypothetical protein n=1 Tax=Nocardioides sp. TaxID=35761 RepID=UPI002ED66358
MNDQLSKAEIGKDAVQHVVEAATTTAGQVASILATALKDVADVLGGFASEVFAIRDSARQTSAEADDPAD